MSRDGIVLARSKTVKVGCFFEAQKVCQSTRKLVSDDALRAPTMRGMLQWGRGGSTKSVRSTAWWDSDGPTGTRASNVSRCRVYLFLSFAGERVSE